MFAWTVNGVITVVMLGLLIILGFILGLLRLSSVFSGKKAVKTSKSKKPRLPPPSITIPLNDAQKIYNWIRGDYSKRITHAEMDEILLRLGNLIYPCFDPTTDPDTPKTVEINKPLIGVKEEIKPVYRCSACHGVLLIEADDKGHYLVSCEHGCHISDYTLTLLNGIYDQRIWAKR